MSTAATTTMPNTVSHKSTAFESITAVMSSAPLLTAFSLFTFLVGFIWFIVELIVVSLNEGDTTAYQVLGPLSSQTLQLYMYAMILAVSSYGASWYAHSLRTRAARQLAVFVSVFSLFAWMWELWFVIPTLRGHGDSTNFYCNTQATQFCRISQAASSMSIILEFCLLLDVAWTVMVAATSVQTDFASTNPNANTEYNADLVETDDLEVLRIAASKGNAFDGLRQRISSLSWTSYGVNVVTMIGWIILTLASIQLSKDIGLNAYNNAPGNTQRWGDPIIATLWFPLTLALGLSIGATAYSAFRLNRTVNAAAMFFAAITALQWSSFFIYSGRRFQQEQEAYGLSSLTDEKAQRAMVSGAGIIVCAEIIKLFVLIARYYTYLPITRADQSALRSQPRANADAPTVIITDPEDPTAKPAAMETVQMDNANTDASMNGAPYYILPYTAGTTYLFQALFFFQLLLLLTFWGNQFVFSSNSGLFKGTPNTNPPYAPETSFYFTQILFLYQTVLILATWFAAFRAEREKSVSSSTASFFVITLTIAGWFLLIWPTAFQALPNQVGDINSAACTEGDGDWCRSTGAASVFSMIELFALVLVWFYSIMRLAQSYTFSVSSINRSSQYIPTFAAIVALCGIAIWALATIRVGVNNEDFLAQQQQQVPSVDGASLPETYWASEVFLILVILTTATWTGISSTLSFDGWQSWHTRLQSYLWSNILVAVLLPFFVLTSRIIQSESINSVHLAVASGIIILFAGAMFYHLAILTQCFDEYFVIAVPVQRKDIVVEDTTAMPMKSVEMQTTTTTVPATAATPVPDPAYTTVPVVEQA